MLGRLRPWEWTTCKRGHGIRKGASCESCARLDHEAYAAGSESTPVWCAGRGRPRHRVTEADMARVLVPNGPVTYSVSSGLCKACMGTQTVRTAGSGAGDPDGV